MTLIIDGKQTANELCEQLTQDVQAFKKEYNITPTIAVVLVGEDPASQVYVRNKIKRAGEIGLRSIDHKLSKDISEEELLTLINKLNNDPDTHGILVQLPLPDHINDEKILDTINPLKDVDGFHVTNVGKLSIGDKQALVPCTPQGCIHLLKKYIGDITGKHAVIIGRSNIVGKPIASLLLAENCTVTIAHSRTQDIKSLTQQADILVAAVGKAEMVDESWLKDGAIVIDVGINRISTPEGKNKLVGDVNFASAKTKAHAITPVPGGVGPMTIACLMANTLKAARNQLKK